MAKPKSNKSKKPKSVTDEFCEMVNELAASVYDDTIAQVFEGESLRRNPFFPDRSMITPSNKYIFEKLQAAGLLEDEKFLEAMEELISTSMTRIANDFYWWHEHDEVPCEIGDFKITINGKPLESLTERGINHRV